MEAKFDTEAIEVRGSLVIYKNIPTNHPEWRFSKGSFGGLDVIILDNHNYINASNLCSQDNKQYTHWSKSVGGAQLIKEFELGIGIHMPGLVIEIHDVATHLRGTYVHRDIIVHVACWISSSFAYRVSKIVNTVLEKENRNIKVKLDQARAEIAKHDNVVAKKDTHISSLEARLLSMEAKLNSVLAGNKSANTKLDIATNMLEDVTDQLEDTKLDNQIIQSELTLVNKKLDIVLPQRVELEKCKSKHNTFLLIRVVKDRQYYWTRTQKGRTKSVLAKQGFSLEDIILRIEPTPNAINLSNMCKEKIPYITTSGNYVYIKLKKEDEFVQDVKDVNDGRYQVNVPSRSEVLNGYSLRVLNNACMKERVPLYSGKTKISLVKHIIEYETREGKTII